MSGTQQTQATERVPADEYDAAIGDRLEVGYIHINGDVHRLVGDVVSVGVDRITVEIEQSFGPDRLYTVHTPLDDGQESKLYGHESNSLLRTDDGDLLPHDHELPTPDEGDFWAYTINRVDELSYSGRSVEVAPAPEKEVGER